MEARRRAAGDLAAAIKVQVKSVVESCTQMVGQKAEDCGSRVLNLNATDLPLLGLDYTSLLGGSEVEGVKARLTLEKSAPLYRETLARLNQAFAAADQVLATRQDNKARHVLLSRQLTLLREIDADY